MRLMCRIIKSMVKLRCLCRVRVKVKVMFRFRYWCWVRTIRQIRLRFGLRDVERQERERLGIIANPQQKYKVKVKGEVWAG